MQVWNMHVLHMHVKTAHVNTLLKDVLTRITSLQSELDFLQMAKQ